jgi:hypothetical protein
MQSCHIVVAVRLKTRMTKLRKRRRAACNRAASADGLTLGFYNQTGWVVCMLFHNWENKGGVELAGLVRRCVRNSAVTPSAIPPYRLLLEAIFSVPFQEMRVWAVGYPMRRKRVTGLVDN